MNSKLKYDIKWYSEQRSPFYHYLSKSLKDGVRFADINECAEAWNAAIKECISISKRYACNEAGCSIENEIRELIHDPDNE